MARRNPPIQDGRFNGCPICAFLSFNLPHAKSDLKCIECDLIHRIPVFEDQNVDLPNSQILAVDNSTGNSF